MSKKCSTKKDRQISEREGVKRQEFKDKIVALLMEEREITRAFAGDCAECFDMAVEEACRRMGVCSCK